MSNTTSALDSKEAYELIRTIYKFIPTYNQIKGTYLGIQFVLNTMGLCAKITELWRDRNGIDNFATEGTIYREDELGAVRRFVSEVGKYKAAVKDYYLTSRFDIDLVANKGISFYEFNGMAKTIVEVVNDMRPVTRCLRRLFFIILINTDIHYNYYLDAENEKYSNEEGETEGHTVIGHVVTPETRSDDNTYGLQIRSYNYLWNVTESPWNKKIEYDSKLYMLKRLYLPWNAVGAKFAMADELPEMENIVYKTSVDEDEEPVLYNNSELTYLNTTVPYKLIYDGSNIDFGDDTEQVIYEKDYDDIKDAYREILQNTLKNTYFNLFELDRKLEKSHQLTFKFIIYARKKGEYRTIIKQEYKDLIIGEDVSFEVDKNGIFVNFHNTIQTILGGLYKDLDLNDVDLFFGTTFNIVLGTKYLYQDKNMPLDIWDINEDNDENLGLIAEISEFPDDIIWLLPENDGERTLLWESYK